MSELSFEIFTKIFLIYWPSICPICDPEGVIKMYFAMYKDIHNHVVGFEIRALTKKTKIPQEKNIIFSSDKVMS